MRDFSNMKPGDRLIDIDGDEHEFIAYVPGRDEPVITYWGDSDSPTCWRERMFPAPKQVMYVNVYDLSGRCQYSSNATRSEADISAGSASNRVACVRVEFTPGQMDK